jgi:hypothetical protein
MHNKQSSRCQKAAQLIGGVRSFDIMGLETVEIVLWAEEEFSKSRMGEA